MADTLLLETRGRLVDERIGLISSEELVAWADAKIANLDSPPDYLISISLRERLDWGGELDLVLRPINDDDCRGIALRILKLLRDDSLMIDDVESLAHTVGLVLSDTSEFYGTFVSIAEDFYLARESGDDLEPVRAQALFDLGRVAGHAA